ncbi:hypothetical protein, variant 2 [Aphanomyces invadans]|uniref:Uncharacterized protein n=1 Tax=Aphanomyces invadans TaxID=157072 RepID=A0A024T9W5_9STRA|nr:hypothetical protein H310_14433 [Aphanomyces invadans]XP_008880515.1 hypothetical protein, variant 2 [Aphanomyces invadans]XP_008880516.1 hypothetical protein, variant 1 [Aphanomyces invadans]ETV90836.1 hypothetical protein H310_14433 [Aphanomyces invadans]ETV90837.1 hypothetical protein, variant 1 [Aphanomyces invadans]ETV90838.1 hypothetical protein, variant 2 [Aphanomyces invadans]|eukprot:XP_008880514.1 hypothetical protein H310_14433 [Aphanomyces invadans]
MPYRYVLRQITMSTIVRVVFDTLDDMASEKLGPLGSTHRRRWILPAVAVELQYRIQRGSKFSISGDGHMKQRMPRDCPFTLKQRQRMRREALACAYLFDSTAEIPSVGHVLARWSRMSKRRESNMGKRAEIS